MSDEIVSQLPLSQAGAAWQVDGVLEGTAGRCVECGAAACNFLGNISNAKLPHSFLADFRNPLASATDRASLTSMSSKQKGDDGLKPELWKAVRVWMDDGTRMHGMWTGTAWWSVKGEIVPVKWELEERPKKTKKISKVLPPDIK